MKLAFGRAVLATVVLVLASCDTDAPPVFTGYAEADLVHISAPAAGAIESLAVVRGARVTAGDELFRLDADVETLSRAEAAARVAVARAQVADLRKGRRPAELRAVEQQLVQARANLAASRAQVSRNRDLVGKGFVSPSRLDDLSAAEERDAARVRELEAQLALAREPARADEIAAAEAQTQAASAALGRDTWREAQMRQVAPVAAFVFDVAYRRGERVAANAPIVSLLPDGALKLRFYVPQAQLSMIRPGALVDVACDGCPSGLSATVSFVSPQAEYTPPVIYSNESRQKLVFLVEARPSAAAASALKPGQPVEVRVAQTAVTAGAK